MILLTTFAKLLNSIKADASKYGILIIMALMVVCACGCTRNNYSSYYDIVSKGGGAPNIFCWQTEEYEWECGAVGCINMNVPFKQIQYMQDEQPCSLKMMNKILRSYTKEVRQNIKVYVIAYHITEQEYMDSYYMSVYDEPDVEIAEFLYAELGLPVSKHDYSPYYNLSTGKGLEVYCWEISDGEWRCGALSGTNRGKWADEIAYLQYELPCPLNEMNKILKAYSGVSIVVFVVDYMQDTSDTLVYKLSQDIPETYKFLYSELGLSVPEYL